MKVLTGLCVMAVAVAAVTPAAAQYYDRGRGYERGYDRRDDRGYDRRESRRETGCVLYEHDGFGGAQLRLRDGASVNLAGGYWNDRASSLSCFSGCSITIYEHDFRGARQTFSGQVSSLGGFWNDKASSARVSCN